MLLMVLVNLLLRKKASLTTHGGRHGWDSNISYFRGRNHNDDGRGKQRSFLEGSCEKPHMSNVFEGLRQLGEWGQHHPSYLLAGVGGGLALMGVTEFLRRYKGANPTTHGSARWSTPLKYVQRASLGPTAS